MGRRSCFAQKPSEQRCEEQAAGEIVECTTEGEFVREISVDQNGRGSFGLDIAAFGDKARFAFVETAT